MWCFVWHLHSAAIKIQKLQYLWNGARDAKGQRQFIVQSVDQPDCTYSDQTTAPGYVLQRIWWSRWHIRNRTTSRNWRLRLWRSGTIYHKTQSASRSRISGTLWACVNEVRTYSHPFNGPLSGIKRRWGHLNIYHNTDDCIRKRKRGHQVIVH